MRAARQVSAPCVARPPVAASSGSGSRRRYHPGPAYKGPGAMEDLVHVQEGGSCRDMGSSVATVDLATDAGASGRRMRK